MPRPRPPYLHLFKTRHGKLIWYVRAPGSKRIRIRAEYGTQQFDAAYQAAIEGRAGVTGKPRTASGSLAWLWERYREVPAWRSLSPATRRARENIMQRVLKAGGTAQCGKVKRSDVVKARDGMADTPSQARAFLDTMRGMFRWAVEALPEQVKSDPTVGVKNPKEATGQGFPVWSEGEVDRYQARWPIGTKERVWIDVLLYTGLRRGDAVTLGRQHVRDGIATLRTEKSQGSITVSLPILPNLAATLAAGPCADLAFICGTAGKPLTKESFGNAFRVACDEAGIKGKSAHGLRKAGATRAADNGATVTELEAIFGWVGGGMASHYTRTADRKRASVRAMTMMERTSDEHSICPPQYQVGITGEKQ